MVWEIFLIPKYIRITPRGKLTCPLKRDHFKRKIHGTQPSIFRGDSLVFRLNLRGEGYKKVSIQILKFLIWLMGKFIITMAFVTFFFVRVFFFNCERTQQHFGRKKWNPLDIISMWWCPEFFDTWFLMRLLLHWLATPSSTRLRMKSTTHVTAPCCWFTVLEQRDWGSRLHLDGSTVFGHSEYTWRYLQIHTYMCIPVGTIEREIFVSQKVYTSIYSPTSKP